MWWLVIVVFLLAWVTGQFGEKPFGDINLKLPQMLGGDASDSDSDSDNDSDSDSDSEDDEDEPTCHDGYERNGDTCSRVVSTPMPLQEAGRIACPMGFNPDDNDSSTCTADSGLSQLLFTPQNKNLEADASNIDSWVETQKSTSEQPLHCMTKQLPNDKHVGVCTSEFKHPGYTPQMRNIHANPSASQKTNHRNYQIAYDVAASAPGIPTCGPDNVMVDNACYNRACTEDSLLKMTQEGPMCVSSDSYNL